MHLEIVQTDLIRVLFPGEPSPRQALEPKEKEETTVALKK